MSPSGFCVVFLRSRRRKGRLGGRGRRAVSLRAWGQKGGSVPRRTWSSPECKTTLPPMPAGPTEWRHSALDLWTHLCQPRDVPYPRRHVGSQLQETKPPLSGGQRRGGRCWCYCRGRLEDALSGGQATQRNKHVSRICYEAHGHHGTYLSFVFFPFHLGLEPNEKGCFLLPTLRPGARPGAKASRQSSGLGQLDNCSVIGPVFKARPYQ